MSRKIGEILTKEGIINEKQLKKALFYMKKLDQDISVGEVLVQLGYVSKQQLLDALNNQKRTGYEPKLHKPNEALVQESSETLLRKLRVLPVEIDNEKSTLYLAMQNTSDYRAVDEMRRIYEVKKVEKIAATEDEIKEIYQRVSNEFSLTVEYVSILSAHTQYIREVNRKGRNLCDIEETQREKHKIHTIVKFKELDDEYKVKLSYNRNRYAVTFPKEEKKKLNPYLGRGWSTNLKDQMLPFIMKNITFYLPKETSEEENN